MRRDKKAYKRYQSKRWKVFREIYLAENPLCKNFDDCHNFAEHVDHIKRIESEEDKLFYDENNLQALCRSCHSKKLQWKTAVLEIRKNRRRIVKMGKETLTIDNDGNIYVEERYFRKETTIHAVIYFKHKNEELKKVFDALKVIELMYKDKIEINIRIKKTDESDMFVLFHNRIILEKLSKLDSYIYIVKKILNKKAIKEKENIKIIDMNTNKEVSIKECVDIMLKNSGV